MALCVICNKPTGCTCLGHWRNIACCPEHYQEYWSKSEGVSGKVPYKLRASDGRLMWDIKDYSIESGDIKLFTTMDGKVLNLSETEYLIILNGEKQHLLKLYEDDGQYIKVNKVDYERMLKLNAIPSVPLSAEISEDLEEAESTSMPLEDDTTFTSGRRKRKT